MYVPNTASPGGVDLVVADTAGGQILRYFGPTGTPTVASTLVYSATSGTGPLQPDGLSVDAAGNLYAVTSAGTNGGIAGVVFSGDADHGDRADRLRVAGTGRSSGRGQSNVLFQRHESPQPHI